MDTILQIFHSSKNIRRDRYLKQIHAIHFLITIKERSKRRASPKISQKVVVSFNFAEKSKHVYSFLFFLSTIASVLLGLTPPPFDFSSSLPESAGRRKNSKKGGRRARGRERERKDGGNGRSRNTYRDLRRRNFSASLPIIVSSIDRTPQFLPTGSRPAAKSVCGRENIDVYRDADVGAPENLISPKDASNGALATLDHRSFLPSFLRFFVTPWDDRGGGDTTENLNWNDERGGEGGFCPFASNRDLPSGEPFTLMARKMEKLKLCVCFSFFFLSADRR